MWRRNSNQVKFMGIEMYLPEIKCMHFGTNNISSKFVLALFKYRQTKNINCCDIYESIIHGNLESEIAAI